MSGRKMKETTPVAIVTGGGQGIGRAIAARLLTDGFRVAVFESSAKARRALEKAHHDERLAVLEVDVAREGAVRAGVRQTLKRFGRLDALVNNAGISNPYNAPVDKLELSDWERTLRVNLTGPLLCTKHALKALRASPRAAVVNIASTRALQSEPHHEAYAAAKGGLVSLTHALAISLGPDVRINAVSPGWIDTSMLKADKSEPAALREVDHSQHPVGRVGEPRDVASLVAWLLSTESGFVTGQNFVIDGGMSRKMIYAE
jgi:NAD(P)-dependent dehydrogenase (short-subunit alcohol dehydrogenase family)